MNINIKNDDITQYSSLPVYPLLVELRAASDAIHEMSEISVGNFQLFEIAWQKFLQSIDRFWNKFKACCYDKKGWQTFESKIVEKRKKDQLLNYLMQARNVTEHTISPVVKDWEANLKATPLNGGVHLSWDPFDRHLLTVINRGQKYPPPQMHLGKPMSFYRAQYKNEPEPIVAAILAMEFYLEWMNKALEKFFPMYSEVKK